MCSVRVCGLGALALIGYVATFWTVARFFDSMNFANGALMVGVWLGTIALFRLADKATSA